MTGNGKPNYAALVLEGLATSPGTGRKARRAYRRKAKKSRNRRKEEN